MLSSLFLFSCLLPAQQPDFLEFLGELNPPAGALRYGDDVGGLGDQTGDGIEDFYILYFDANGQAVYDFLNGADFSILQSGIVTVAPNSYGGSTLAVIDDWTGDGAPEIVFQTGFGKLACFSTTNMSSSIWAFDDNGSTTGAPFTFIQTAPDLNLDGFLDVLVSNPSTNNRYLISSSGSLIFTYDFWGDEDDRVSALTDLDGDGRGDWATVVYDSQNGLMYHRIHMLGSNSFPTIGETSSTTVDLMPRSIGDLNGDGTSEIAHAVWLNQATEITEVLDGASLSIISSQTASGGILFSLTARGTPQDWNEDGVPDYELNMRTHISLRSGADASEIGILNNISGSMQAGFASVVVTLSQPNGSTLLTSAPFATNTSGAPVGAVYLWGIRNSGPPEGGGDQNGTGGSWDLSGNIDGNGPGDEFGKAAARLRGDMDLDGCEDLLVGIPGADPAGLTDAGEVQIVRFDGSILATFSNSNNANEGMGSSLAGLKDINGNGTVDFVTGAPYAMDSSIGLPGGAVYVWDSQGTLLARLESPNSQIGGRFGAVVANIGDINGDFILDFAVGAPGESANNVAETGNVYLFDGASQIQIATLAGSPSSGGNATGFGSAIAMAGLSDSDSVMDFAVGSPGGDSNTFTDNGYVDVFSGANLGSIITLHGEADGDESGTALSDAVDFNEDGEPDLVIGEPGVDIVIPFRGITINGGGNVRVRGSKSGGTVIKHGGDSENGGNGTTVTSGNHGGEGHSASGGSPYTTGTIRAAVNRDAGMVTTWGGDGQIMFRRLGSQADDQLGNTVVGGADLNCDGRDDLVFGSGLADTANGADSGTLSIFSLDPLASSSGNSLSASQGGTYLIDVDFPITNANQLCHTLLSLSGTGPTDIGGLRVPVTADKTFWASVFGSYPGNGRWVEWLDSQGDVSFSIVVGPGQINSAVGRTYTFAFVAHRWKKLPTIASRAVQLTILP